MKNHGCVKILKKAGLLQKKLTPLCAGYDFVAAKYELTVSIPRNIYFSSLWHFSLFGSGLDTQKKFLALEELKNGRIPIASHCGIIKRQRKGRVGGCVNMVLTFWK